MSLLARALDKVDRTLHPPRPLVLHIGLHKTATTAMQEFFAAKRATIARHGATFVPLEEMRARYTPEILEATTKDDLPQTAALLTDQCRRAVILSDENIIGTTADVWRARLYHGAEHRVMRVVWAGLPRPAAVFLTLREPAAFFVSMYCEYLRHHDFIEFETYYENMDLEGFSYDALFGWLRQLPSYVAARVIPFEPALGGGLPVVAGAVLQAACGRRHGVDLSRIPRIHNRASFSAEAVTRIREAAAGGPAAAAAAVRAIDAEPRRETGAPFAPLDPGLAARLGERYRDELEGFRRAEAERAA